MATTMFSLGGLFAPLHGLLTWLVPAPAVMQRRSMDAHPAIVRSRGRSLRPAQPLATAPCRKSVRPLRVFQRHDAPASPARIAISGTMADVCAELERLAAMEAKAM